jgi:hypothetical protein
LCLISSTQNCSEAKHVLSKRRQYLWLQAIRRDDLFRNAHKMRQFIKYGHVCGNHFHSGKSAKLMDCKNIDWVPSLFMGYDKVAPTLKPDVQSVVPINIQLKTDQSSQEKPLESLKIFIPDHEYATADSNVEFIETYQPKTVYKCGFCAQNFHTIASINRHLKDIHCSGKGKIAHCASCSATFMGAADLRAHIATVHKDLQSEQQKFEELHVRLKNYDGCSCRLCVDLCDNFLEHLNAKHVRADLSETETEDLVETTDYFDITVNNLSFAKSTTNDDFDKDLTSDFNTREPTETGKLDNKQLVHTKERAKVTNKKKYVCTVCQKQLQNSTEMCEHSKMHLIENKAAKSMDSNDIQFSAATIIQDNPPKDKKFTELKLKTNDKFFEYQCSLCGDVSISRDAAKTCLQKHANNGWPADDVNMTFLNALAKEKVVDAGNVENWEENLEQIAANYMQTKPAETLYYKCEPCKLYYDCSEDIRQHLALVHQEYSLSDEHEVKISCTIKCKYCALDSNQNICFATLLEAMQHRHEKHSYSMDALPDQTLTRYIVRPDDTDTHVTGKRIYYREKCILEEYKCDCDRVYNSKRLATKCMAKHVGIRRYKCLKGHMITSGEF